jgi:hypothetical protein
MTVAAMPDADHDGISDMIASVLFYEPNAEVQGRLPDVVQTRTRLNPPRLSRRAVLAVSGRTGRRLWSYPAGVELGTIEPADTFHNPAILKSRGATLVAVVDGPQWVGVDAATGQPRVGPIDLGADPLHPLRYVDLDGDGEPEALGFLGPNPLRPFQTLAAFSCASGRQLWTAPVRPPVTVPYDDRAPVAWPVVADLDGDGRPEIAVPDAGPLPPAHGYRGVQLLDGGTGQVRWSRAMRPETKAIDGVAHAIAVGDLDHDGVRDLVTTSIFIGRNPATTHQRTPPDEERVYVDALSGKDGRPLWWWHADIPSDKPTRIRPPLLWGSGPDGWPLLAVTLGGIDEHGPQVNDHVMPPVAHMLELSTGREIHTIAGLTNPAADDLNGDGLPDFWGQVDGRLWAFRGEAPERWRALDTFAAAGDLDGDGQNDVFCGAMAPYAGASERFGGRTALARSGRDGHLLWKREVDWRLGLFDEEDGEAFQLQSFPLPRGDLDGDGIADVLAECTRLYSADEKSPRPATFLLRLLSGRDGRPLWSAGPLPLSFATTGFFFVWWIDARVIEPGGPPDLIVIPTGPNTPHLARISGRDGHVVWGIPLRQLPTAGQFGYNPQPLLDDLDGDGALDLVMSIPPVKGTNEPDWALVAVSLSAGKILWSQPLGVTYHEIGAPLWIGDLDGDRRPEAIVLDEVSQAESICVRVRALDGRDGSLRWSWTSGAQFSADRLPPSALVADLTGLGKASVYVSFLDRDQHNRIVVLSAKGRATAERTVPGERCNLRYAGDLNGDGRAELLIARGAGLHVWGPDLHEIWSRPNTKYWYDEIIPARPGHPATIEVYPCLGLDGATGAPRWSALPSLTGSANCKLLDHGDAASLPAILEYRGDTISCRNALATTAQGTIAALRGSQTPAGRARHDPRWTRPLPWATPLAERAIAKGVPISAGLALVNVGLPLLILRLASRRRVLSVRTLMALPVAAAVSLSAYVGIEPLLPPPPALANYSTKALFFLGTAVGIPILAYIGLLAACLVRRRIKLLALLVVLTVVAALAIGGAWIAWDARTKPALDEYGWSDWHLVFILGIYAVGTAAVGAVIIRGLTRWAQRLLRRAGERVA